MSPRIAALLDPTILFAHRGGAAHAPENTLEAFRTGLELGSNGLESDIWVSKDNQAVLIHDGSFGRSLRRRKVADTLAADLPPEVPTLNDLYDAVGVDYDLSVDIKTPDAIDATVDAVRAASERSGHDLVSRTWLCHPDLELVTSWRQRWSDIRLVHSTRVGKVQGGPERHASLLFDRQIDAVNFHQSDWSGGLTTLYHRFGIYCFGWDAHLERVASELLHMGCDAIFSDYVGRMLNAQERVYGS
ncbi:MAG: glycerophosphodiester phosphodiesterase [Acidimicrobiales bacterium]